MRNVVLLVLFAACGDDGVRHVPDATPHDGPATPDGPVDAAPTPVAITTTVNGQAVGGVHVYFQNADGSVVLATVTDASGNASAVMAAGGYVTAINTYTPPALATTNDEVDTFLGVKPGDHLRLAMGATNTTITVNVTAPLDANQAATLYSVFSPCGQAGLTSAGSGAAPSGTMYLSNCGATSDFLVVSYDQSNTPLDSFFVTNVAVADLGTVDLTAHTYGAVATRTYTYNNPGAQTSFSFTDSLLDTGAAIYTINGFTNTGSATGSYALPAFTGAGDLMVTTINDNRDVQTFADWGPYSSAYATDVGARLLPPLTSSPMFDPATHTSSFTVDTTGAAPDFVYSSIDALRTADSHGWTWRIAAPYATSIVYPQLPTDVYDYNITANDGPGNIQLAFGKVPGGYDGVRPYLLSVPGNPQADQFATGTTGTATVEQYALLARGTARKMAPNRHPVLSHRRR